MEFTTDLSFRWEMKQSFVQQGSVSVWEYGGSVWVQLPSSFVSSPQGVSYVHAKSALYASHQVSNSHSVQWLRLINKNWHWNLLIQGILINVPPIAIEIVLKSLTVQGPPYSKHKGDGVKRQNYDIGYWYIQIALLQLLEKEPSYQRENGNSSMISYPLMKMISFLHVQ